MKVRIREKLFNCIRGNEYNEVKFILEENKTSSKELLDCLVVAITSNRKRITNLIIRNPGLDLDDVTKLLEKVVLLVEIEKTKNVLEKNLRDISINNSKRIEV